MRRREVIQTGQTGATFTSNSLELDGDPDDVGFEFVVEAVGATPTVTFKWQGSFDGVNWFDHGYITDATSTEAFTARTVTALGAYIQWRYSITRRYRYIRCVVTANTNCTYRAALTEFD